MDRNLIQIAICLAAFAMSAGAQTTVTTSGTTSTGTVPVFNGTATVTNSPITVSGGNVGIGTPNPQSSLHIVGDTGIILQSFAPSGVTQGMAFWYYDHTGAFRGQFGRGYDYQNWWGYVAPTGWAFVVNDIGNVGIGTTSPARKLHIAGDVQIDGNLYFGSNSQPQSAPYAGCTGGDYAESMDVSGDRTEYAPGDVLVLDTDNPGKIVTSVEPYSMAVAGIYSTKPGTVGRRQLTPKSDSEVPMAMVGVVPTKVTAENGSIKVGDLLVSSSRRGYAMKGTDRSRMLGAIIGKAMGTLDSGTGTIEVLVTLQ